jgi:hypothetical protein
MMANPTWSTLKNVPPGTLNIEPDPEDPILYTPVPHANVIQMSHTDQDLYIWFGEGIPPFIAHNAEDIPEDFKVIGRTVAFVSLPVQMLFNLRSAVYEQLKVYKSRFGSTPPFPKWYHDRYDEEDAKIRRVEEKSEERDKIKALINWGWITESKGYDLFIELERKYEKASSD